MTPLSFESCVAFHRQNQFAGGANDAPGALNEGTAKGLDLSKATLRRRMFVRVKKVGSCQYIQIAESRREGTARRRAS